MDANTLLGALHCLVHDIGAHQYFLQIDTECVSETCYIDSCSIRVCLTMVSRLRISGFSFPKLENGNSST